MDAQTDCQPEWINEWLTDYLHLLLYCAKMCMSIYKILNISCLYYFHFYSSHLVSCSSWSAITLPVKQTKKKKRNENENSKPQNEKCIFWVLGLLVLFFRLFVRSFWCSFSFVYFCKFSLVSVLSWNELWEMLLTNHKYSKEIIILTKYCKRIVLLLPFATTVAISNAIGQLVCFVYFFQSFSSQISVIQFKIKAKNLFFFFLKKEIDKQF